MKRSWGTYIPDALLFSNPKYLHLFDQLSARQVCRCVPELFYTIIKIYLIYS